MGARRDHTVLMALFEALHHAETKHPKWPDDPVTQLVILMEEVGEASEAALASLQAKQFPAVKMHDGSLVPWRHAYREELLDAGAVILRALLWCEEREERMRAEAPPEPGDAP